VVTDDLRDALQAAQGLSVGDDSEDAMPSLSSQAIRTLFAGKVETWSQVIDSSGDSLVDIATTHNSTRVVTDPDYIDFVPTAGDDDETVHICRRRQGSGTHAQIAALIMRTNCSGGVDIPEYTAPLNFIKPQVSAAQGSGDMTDCLDNIGDGHSTAYDGDNVYTGKTRWGVGYQSVEKNASLSAAYRFIKIDGSAPTLDNIHAGKYYDFAESTLQRRGGNGDYNSTITSGALGDMSADVTAMFDEIAVSLAQHDSLVSINAGSKFAHPWTTPTTQGGWLANPNVSGNTPDKVLDLYGDGTPANPGNPTNAYAHEGANTCQPAIQASTINVVVD
jgi:ABC-type phosphate transport system substrate-binding protein